MVSAALVCSKEGGARRGEREEVGPVAVCFLQRARRNREDSRQVASSEWSKA